MMGDGKQWGAAIRTRETDTDTMCGSHALLSGLAQPKTHASNTLCTDSSEKQLLLLLILA